MFTGIELEKTQAIVGKRSLCSVPGMKNYMERKGLLTELACSSCLCLPLSLDQSFSETSTWFIYTINTVGLKGLKSSLTIRIFVKSHLIL